MMHSMIGTGWMNVFRRLTARTLACVAGVTLTTVPAAYGAENRPHLTWSLQQDQLRLEWSPAAPQARYTVETASQVAGSNWTPVGSPDLWPTLETSWTGPRPAGAAAFYRLQILPPVPSRGTVEALTLLRQFTVAEINAIIADYGVPGIQPVAVAAWRVEYLTVDPQGEPIPASALVVVPSGGTTPVPLVSYQHGTVTEREDVPSRLNSEADLGLVLASARYLVVMPDYLGLGDSPGLHPYHHADSTATAVVDALRATRDSLTELSVAWNEQLFLLGYSQGGHATLAAQRSLEQQHAGEFTLTASAPMAGAYDLSGTTLNDFLSTRQPPNPYYYPYILSMLVEVYGVAESLGDLLRAPYDTTIPPLLNGQHSGGTINAALPSHPLDAMKPELVEALRNNPNHPIRLALQDNDLHTGWVPQTPTRLYHCAGDRDVLPANTDVALSTFTAAGATQVTKVDPFFLANHSTCAPLALLQAKLWFDSLRR